VWPCSPAQSRKARFATLLGANKINVAVLIDSSTKDVGAVKRLRDNDQLAKNGLVEISELIGTADADIEDLFERDFYLDLVNRAYTGRLPAPITTADLNGNDPRIVRQVEAYFRTNNIAGGRFDHLKPARVLLREQAQLPTLGNDMLNRIDQLFTRLNSLIRTRR
jgi:hypothetical protein